MDYIKKKLEDHQYRLQLNAIIVITQMIIATNQNSNKMDREHVIRMKAINSKEDEFKASSNVEPII